MKSKQNDAQLIAEAYNEVVEEALPALAAGIARGAAAAGRGAAAVAKKVAPIAGKAIKKTAKIGAGAALGAADGAADGVAQAVGGLAKGVVQGATGAIEGAVGAASDEEGDMSQSPGQYEIEVKEVEVPSIHSDVDVEPRVNHHDDSEIKMALAELYKIEKYAFGLGLMLKEMPALEGWTAAKITKAADYLGSVFHKLDYDVNGHSMHNTGYEDAMEDGE